MSSSQRTTDLDAQIAKLEEKLNELLDKVQNSKTPQKTNSPEEIVQPAQEPQPTPEPTLQRQEYSPPQVQTESVRGKSRKEILAEYEKGYLARLEQSAKAEEEIRRAASELQAKKSTPQTNSTRGSLPKGF